MDWDINYDFDATAGSDEIVLATTNLNKGLPEIVDPGMTFTITVPQDAVVGTSRLRIVASDAWFPHPGPTGGTAKGFSIDFPVEISGTNPQRERPKTYADYRDQGEADEAEGVGGVKDAVIKGQGAMSVNVANGIATFKGAEKAWIYTTTGQFVQYVDNATAPVSVEGLANGIYVVKMQNGQFVRSEKFVKK